MQKIKSIAITLFLGVAAVSLTISPAWTADLITFDLTADWSDSSNPNGVWSYEVNGVIAASGTRSGDTFGTPTPIWGSGFTGWSKSNGTEGFFHDWSAGDVFGHTPTPAGSIAIAWTSPDDGTVDINGGIWEGRDIGRSNVWSLTKNGVTLTGGSIASGDAFDSSNPFDFLTGSGGSSAITGISVSTGDILSAIPVMKMAARSSGPRDAESAAWIYTRLSALELQSGDFEEALRAADVALGFQAAYAPALFAKGRTLLAQGRYPEAVEMLEAAASRNPLPEYQWLLADTLRSVDRLTEADQVEAELKRAGRTQDPRALALFLSTRGEQTADALRFAREELEARSDVFTFDALAWALHRAGETEDARGAIARALAEGTEDARLFFHAGAIAAAAGRRGEAADWTQRSYAIRQMLYPSERRQLIALRADLTQTKTSL